MGLVLGEENHFHMTGDKLHTECGFGYRCIFFMSIIYFFAGDDVCYCNY